MASCRNITYGQLLILPDGPGYLDLRFTIGWLRRCLITIDLESFRITSIIDICTGDRLLTCIILIKGTAGESVYRTR